ncbi:MAG: hypothetical protein DRR11_18190 [Gammaproteobacteria bacterium]|nr:MAG: hypothetical protein DRR11_18190 [Gammaproteobacteria bacterium]
MSKSRAFLFHLSASATIVGIVCALIFFVWYPQPYFDIVGAGAVLKILIGVDLVVGPLLTLFLYKPNKPNLKFDLSVIVAIQLIALIYGTTVIYQERPYYVVFAIDRFEVVGKTEIDTSDIRIDALREKPLIGPMLVVALFPDSEQERQELLNDVLSGKPDLERRPEYWDVYAKHSDSVIARGITLPNMADKRPDARDKIEAFIQSQAHSDEMVGLPIIGKKGAFYFVLNSTTRRPLGVINFDPWEPSVPATDSTD